MRFPSVAPRFQIVTIRVESCWFVELKEAKICGIAGAQTSTVRFLDHFNMRQCICERKRTYVVKDMPDKMNTMSHL